ncbi:MAG: hypothetical protein WAW96_07470 [Alphaproteobacteria bacterium]
MLQFLIGLSYVNIAWLLGSSMQRAVYNLPPLSIVAALALLGTGFYSFKLKSEAFWFLLIVSVFGVSAALYHGLTIWHVRQILAFGAAAAVWMFLYQVGSKRDIITMSTTATLLTIYAVFALIEVTERVLFNSAVLGYVVGSIFSYHPDTIVNYTLSNAIPRLSYFSNEPSSAAYAIAAVIMPYIAANAVVEKSRRSLALLAIASFVLYMAEGVTSEVLLLFTISFVIFPRLTVIGVPAVMATVLIGVIGASSLIEDRQDLIRFLLGTFGGISSRIDVGFESGSYLSRLSNWFIGAKTFLQAPIFGQGFGGTGANFFGLVNSGYDLIYTAEQQGFLEGDIAPTNAQMVLRIPAEIGIAGTAYILYKALGLIKFVLRVDSEDRMAHYAFLYALGAMLLSFTITSEYLSPMISSFVVLLAQLLRKRSAHAVPAESPQPSQTPIVPGAATAEHP